MDENSDMPEVNILIDEIIKKKPEITKEKIYDLINEKKKKVGAGYLTDSGAAFLVASDLNIPLEVNYNSELSLKDLYIGANEISVTGRVLSIYPIKTYVKKNGEKGKYRHFIIFDRTELIKVTFWVDNVDFIEINKIKVNDIILINKGYVKSGFDGKPVINVGYKGKISTINDINVNNRIPTIEQISRDISTITISESNLVLNGILHNTPRISKYLQRNGKSGELFYFLLRSSLKGNYFRVSIWNNNLVSKIELKTNSLLRLISVKSRILNDRSIEIHGNEGTTINVISTPQQSYQFYNEEFRILSIGKLRSKEKSFTTSLLVINKNKNYYTLILSDEATNLYHLLKINNIIKCKVRALSPNILICNKINLSIIEKDIDSIPKFEDHLLKINEIINHDFPINLDVIALSRTEKQEIISKKGEKITKSEILVGDETKEIKVVAWRNLSDQINDIKPGQRLRLMGVLQTKGLGDKNEIHIKSYSKISKLS